MDEFTQPQADPNAQPVDAPTEGEGGEEVPTMEPVAPESEENTPEEGGDSVM